MIKRFLGVMLLTLLGGCMSSEHSEAEHPFPLYRLSISKQTMQLTVYDAQNRVLALFPIACGKSLGNKREEGDMRTPEGCFTVQEILDASRWKHDFGDGKGVIDGAYGPYFIRLYAPPHRGIGIHGTHDEGSIGSRATEGCIRLRNRDLRALMRYIYVEMQVEILPAEADRKADEAVVVEPCLPQISF